MLQSTTLSSLALSLVVLLLHAVILLSLSSSLLLLLAILPLSLSPVHLPISIRLRLTPWPRNDSSSGRGFTRVPTVYIMLRTTPIRFPVHTPFADGPVSPFSSSFFFRVLLLLFHSRPARLVQLVLPPVGSRLFFLGCVPCCVLFFSLPPSLSLSLCFCNGDAGFPLHEPPQNVRLSEARASRSNLFPSSVASPVVVALWMQPGACSSSNGRTSPCPGRTWLSRATVRPTITPPSLPRASSSTFVPRFPPLPLIPAS